MSKLISKCLTLMTVRGRPPDRSRTINTRNLYLAPPFLVSDYEPVAVRAHREGKLTGKVALARAELENCTACPRNCKVNRLEDKRGACNTGR